MTRQMSLRSININRLFTGADPGFFLGGGALVSCSTSTPINHIFFCRIPVVLENRRSSGGVRTPCTLPLDPPLVYGLGKLRLNNKEFLHWFFIFQSAKAK